MTSSDKSMNNSNQRLRVTYALVIRHDLHSSAHRTQLIAISMNERVIQFGRYGRLQCS